LLDPHLYRPNDAQLTEWEMGGGALIRHLPTSTIFRIGVDEEARRKGKASLDDFYAQLVHACDAKWAPDQGMDQDSLNFLGRGAIAVYLQEIGVWKPVVVEIPDRPEHDRMRRNWPTRRL
jgi:hypothetical protein